MTPERPSPPPPPSRPEHSEPWRHERMVQRVPAHLGETTRETVSPWIMLAGVALLLVVVCVVLFVLLGGASSLGFGGNASTATPTRVPRSATPAVPILPATLPPSSPTPGPTAATVKYKVKSGDTLSAIATKYKVSVQAIMAANNLKDDNIRIGDELIIPLPTPTPQPGSGLQPPPASTPTSLALESPPTPAASAATPGVIRHIVKRGDTLIGIAASYGSTVEAIRIANRLESDLLSVGQELLVPIGAWTPTATVALVVNATATPTAQFAYAAPNLMGPPDNQAFHGNKDVPMLEWLSVGTLKLNEFYVVHIDYTWNGERKSIVRQVNQGTSVKLEAADYPGANPNGAPFSWYVVVVSQTTGPPAPAQNPQTFAQSPSSATRTFVWY